MGSSCFCVLLLSKLLVNNCRFSSGHSFGSCQLEVSHRLSSGVVCAGGLLPTAGWVRPSCMGHKDSGIGSVDITLPHHLSSEPQGESSGILFISMDLQRATDPLAG